VRSGEQTARRGWDKPPRDKREPGRGCCSRVYSLVALEGKDQPPRTQISKRWGRNPLLLFFSEFSEILFTSIKTKLGCFFNLKKINWLEV